MRQRDTEYDPREALKYYRRNDPAAPIAAHEVGFCRESYRVQWSRDPVSIVVDVSPREYFDAAAH